MNWHDEDTLFDLVIAAERIIKFHNGMTKVEFIQDIKTQSAIQHQLMVMGEAVKRLSEEFRAEHPEIRWSSVAGMRDRLIHAYERVSLDIVWDTAITAVPDFLKKLQPLLVNDSDD